MRKQNLVADHEMKRVISLAELDLDYSDMQDALGELSKLAATVAGTEISLINLIDSFTQWTISQYGFSLEQMPREDSICQYTIHTKEYFEVKDLAGDGRFKDLSYVKDESKLKYYFGVPLQTEDGYALGALCVLDKVGKELSAEQVSLLKIIAAEIVKRLTDIKLIQSLRSKVKESHETVKKVAHDIRGPLGGIVNLAQIMVDQGTENSVPDMLEVMQMIQTSGGSLLEFAEEILTPELTPENEQYYLNDYSITITSLKDKLLRLFSPPAIHKKIFLNVDAVGKSEAIPFAKSKILQICGNLISNAIKFTPEGGTVNVSLELVPGSGANILRILVSDTGVGVTAEQIEFILKGTPSSTDGTDGEAGHGYGMYLVKHLIDSMNGTMHIKSEQQMGTHFEIVLPQGKLYK